MNIEKTFAITIPDLARMTGKDVGSVKRAYRNGEFRRDLGSVLSWVYSNPRPALARRIITYLIAEKVTKKMAGGQWESIGGEPCCTFTYRKLQQWTGMSYVAVAQSKSREYFSPKCPEAVVLWCGRHAKLPRKCALLQRCFEANEH